MQSPRLPFPCSPPHMPHTILTRLSRFVFHSRPLERGLGVSDSMESRVLFSLVTLSFDLASRPRLTVSSQANGQMYPWLEGARVIRGP